MEKINVYYNDLIVGYLARYEDKYAFEYDSAWLNNGFSISPFSLPLRRGVFIPKKWCLMVSLECFQTANLINGEIYY